MGIMDAFSKEDRVEITVSQLISTIESAERAAARFHTVMAMIEAGIPAKKIMDTFVIMNEKGV